MMKRYRSTGNWAEDIGRGIELTFWLAIGACITSVVLFVAVIVLAILLIT